MQDITVMPNRISGTTLSENWVTDDTYQVTIGERGEGGKWYESPWFIGGAAVALGVGGIIIVKEGKQR